MYDFDNGIHYPKQKQIDWEFEGNWDEWSAIKRDEVSWSKIKDLGRIKQILEPRAPEFLHVFSIRLEKYSTNYFVLLEDWKWNQHFRLTG